MRPEQADRSGEQHGGGHGDPDQDPCVVPGEAEFIHFTEVNDLDIGQRVFAVDVECVIVGQAGERFTPPGRVAQPANHGGEGQNGRPGLERGPLDSPDLAIRAQSRPRKRRRHQTASGTARIAPGKSLVGR